MVIDCDYGLRNSLELKNGMQLLAHFTLMRSYKCYTENNVVAHIPLIGYRV